MLQSRFKRRGQQMYCAFMYVCSYSNNNETDHLLYLANMVAKLY